MSPIDLTAVQFIEGIADALIEDFGDDPSTVKTIGLLTGAAPGTVKKWLAKNNGPGGEMLVKLLAVSPAVRAFVDRVSRRDDHVAEFNAKLRQAMAIMDGKAGVVVDMVPALKAELDQAERRPPAPSQSARAPVVTFREWKVSR